MSLVSRLNNLTYKYAGVLLVVMLAHGFLFFALAQVTAPAMAPIKKTKPITIKFIKPPKPKVVKPKPKPKAVKPKVVKPKPIKPKPPKPKPTKPKPKPTKPKPAKPKPTKPKKQTPEPAKPKPTKPKPAKAKPVEKQPAKPVAVKQPQPVQPEPVEEPITNQNNEPVVEKPTETETAPAPQPKAEPLPGNIDARFEKKGVLSYPKRAQRRGLEGSVDLTFVIGKDGRAKNVVAVRSDNPSFSKAAIKFIKASTFAVQKVGGQVVEQPAKTTVVFALE